MKLSELKTIVQNKFNEVGILFKEDESIFSRKPFLITQGIGVRIRNFRTNGFESIFSNMSESEISNALDKYIEDTKNYMREAKIVTINLSMSLKDFTDSFAKFMGTSVPTENLESTPISDLIDQIRNVK